MHTKYNKNFYFARLRDISFARLRIFKMFLKLIIVIFEDFKIARSLEPRSLFVFPYFFFAKNLPIYS
jgi:hypothetical protein